MDELVKSLGVAIFHRRAETISHWKYINYFDIDMMYENLIRNCSKITCEYDEE